MSVTRIDINQTVASAAAWVAKSIPSTTGGQRILDFLEELTKTGLDVRRDDVDMEAKCAVVAAHAAISVRPHDISRFFILYKAALSDDVAKEHIEQTRSGVHTTGYGAYSTWRKRVRRAAKKLERKGGRPYMAKDSLSRQERKQVLLDAKSVVDSKLTTNAQRALSMCRLLVKAGFARLDQSGGPVSDKKIRESIEKTICVPHGEIGHGLTILRKEAAGSLPRGAIEAIESGRYTSCGTFLKTISSRPRKRVEIVKDDEWMRERAREVDSDVLVSNSMTTKILAYQQIIVENNILDPTSRLSRRIGPVTDAAISVLKCSKHEFRACWTVMRWVARKRLPASILDKLKLGAVSATLLLKEGGGSRALAKAAKLEAPVRSRPVHPQKPVSTPVARGVPREVAPIHEADSALVCIANVVNRSAPAVVNSGGELVPADHLRVFVSDMGDTLDAIIERLKKIGDSERVRVAELLRNEVGLAKSRVSQIGNRAGVMSRRFM